MATRQIWDGAYGCMLNIEDSSPNLDDPSSLEMLEDGPEGITAIPEQYRDVVWSILAESRQFLGATNTPTDHARSLGEITALNRVFGKEPINQILKELAENPPED